MTGADVELVTSFDSLQAGDTVRVDFSDGRRGDDHLLVRVSVRPTERSHGAGCEVVRGWVVAPCYRGCPGHGDHGRCVITDRLIACRQVWRYVIPPAQAEQERTKSRPLERVR